MARIRHVQIENFRCIQHLVWVPSPGINCLIGPGDSGKSSILDAIDYCLGARRAPPNLATAGPKPILVLTHTNAGVAALRGRLERASVPTSAYRLATIDGWAMRLLTLFPQRAGNDPDILSVTNPPGPLSGDPRGRTRAVGRSAH
jgi:hypothetical protein